MRYKLLKKNEEDAYYIIDTEEHRDTLISRGLKSIYEELLEPVWFTRTNNNDFITT